MAKKIVAIVKLQLPASKANPAPPVGPALGQHGVNIMGFCKEYNARTQGQSGTVPVEITIYGDRSFSFVLKTPPSKDLLLKAAGVSKGSANAFTTKVGQVTRAQIKEIARVKMPDLNAVDIEGAMLMIEGAARSMGITVVD